MNTKDDIYILLGRATEACKDLAHLAINREKEIERLEALLASRPEAMPQEPTMDMMLAWINAGVRPEFRSVPGSLSAVDIDQMTMRYKAMLAAMRLAMNSERKE